MGWLWIIIAAIIFAIGMYVLGRWDMNDDKFNYVPMIGVASVVWPLLLALVVILGPFVGLFFLGEYVRKKKDTKK